jgi:cell wall-associated NlpC family hydrolase
MSKTTVTITLILLAEMTLPLYASSARKAHRPWLMIGAHKHMQRPVAVQETPVASQPTVTPVAAAPAPEPSASPEGNRVVEQALKYRGTRYRFGGINKKGIDCSGLVARIYEDLKYKRLPHASAALYNSGTAVHLSELRPGDLVFFKNTYRRGISHVGIYAGSNKFIHAANHKTGVIITAMSDPYYQLHYAGARRLY